MYKIFPSGNQATSHKVTIFYPCFRAGKKSGAGSKPQAVDVKLKKLKKGGKGEMKGSDAKAEAIASLVGSKMILLSQILN